EFNRASINERFVMVLHPVGSAGGLPQDGHIDSAGELLGKSFHALPALTRVRNETSCSRCETSVEPFHLGNIRDFIVKKLVALETEAPDQARQWLKAAIFPFILAQMRQICVGALASLDEAKASGKWSSNSFHKSNVSVYVTSFPVETQQARTAYYADGYF